MKRQLTEWEKRFASDATDKHLIFKHTVYITQHQNKKITQ